MRLICAAAIALMLASPASAGFGGGAGATDKAYDFGGSGFKQYVANKGRHVFDWKKSKLRWLHQNGYITTGELKRELKEFRHHRRGFLQFLRSW